jgi:hypothetical protein
MFYEPASEGSFLNKVLRLQKSLHLGAKMNQAPPLHRRKLVPRCEVGAYASFKKPASGFVVDELPLLLKRNVKHSDGLCTLGTRRILFLGQDSKQTYTLDPILLVCRLECFLNDGKLVFILRLLNLQITTAAF